MDRNKEEEIVEIVLNKEGLKGQFRKSELSEDMLKIAVKPHNEKVVAIEDKGRSKGKVNGK